LGRQDEAARDVDAAEVVGVGRPVRRPARARRADPAPLGEHRRAPHERPLRLAGDAALRLVLNVGTVVVTILV